MWDFERKEVVLFNLAYAYTSFYIYIYTHKATTYKQERIRIFPKLEKFILTYKAKCFLLVFTKNILVNS